MVRKLLWGCIGICKLEKIFTKYKVPSWHWNLNFKVKHIYMTTSMLFQKLSISENVMEIFVNIICQFSKRSLSLSENWDKKNTKEKYITKSCKSKLERLPPLLKNKTQPSSFSFTKTINQVLFYRSKRVNSSLFFSCQHSDVRCFCPDNQHYREKSRKRTSRISLWNTNDLMGFLRIQTRRDRRWKSSPITASPGPGWPTDCLANVNKSNDFSIGKRTSQLKSRILSSGRWLGWFQGGITIDYRLCRLNN